MVQMQLAINMTLPKGVPIRIDKGGLPGLAQADLYLAQDLVITSCLTSFNMANDWAVHPQQTQDAGLWLVNTEQGCSAFICPEGGRIHFFQDFGKTQQGAEDDCGYLLIHDLTKLIELLKELRKYIRSLQAGQPPRTGRKTSDVTSSGETGCSGVVEGPGREG